MKGLQELKLILEALPYQRMQSEGGDFVTRLFPNPLFQSLASSTHPLVT